MRRVTQIIDRNGMRTSLVVLNNKKPHPVGVSLDIVAISLIQYHWLQY